VLHFNNEAFFVETFVSLQAQLIQNGEWVIVEQTGKIKRLYSSPNWGITCPLLFVAQLVR